MLAFNTNNFINTNNTNIIPSPPPRNNNKDNELIQISHQNENQQSGVGTNDHDIELLIENINKLNASKNNSNEVDSLLDDDINLSSSSPSSLNEKIKTNIKQHNNHFYNNMSNDNKVFIIKLCYKCLLLF